MKLKQKCITLLLLASLSATIGCNSTSKENISSEVSSNSVVATAYDKASEDEVKSSLQAKYASTEESEFDYDPEVLYIDRDYRFAFDIAFDSEDKGITDDDIFKIYLDNDFSLSPSYSVLNFSGQVSILPLSASGYNFTVPDWDDNVDGLSGECLGGKSLGDHYWGNLSQFYLVQYYDLETGEALDKPLVKVVRIRSQLDSVYPTYTVSDTGAPYISWAPVEGATEYLVLESTFDDENKLLSSKLLGRTSDTTYVYEDELANDGVGQNYRFKTYTFGDDASEDLQNWNAGGPQHTSYLSVIAVNDKYSSPITSLMSIEEYGKYLPNCKSTYANEDRLKWCDSFMELAPDISITMCDGSLSNRIMWYDISNIKTREDNSSTTYVEVPYTILGTAMSGSWGVHVKNEDMARLDELLAELQARQEGLLNKSGGERINYEVIDDEEDSSNLKEEVEKQTKSTTLEDMPITASSAMGEYIAINLLSNTEYIDLDGFSKSVDTDAVFDSLLEAYYQNPLCLGITAYAYSPSEKILKVEYKESKDTLEKKQREVLDEANKIIAEIITNGMSDLEKEIAINDYLCESAEYDNAALENAEANNFMPDEKFKDSFTPYGVLVNKVGVCASYAGSFKILADLAGLECIVATGDLDGQLPHAWNRVKIDDEWLIVDSTNNDNDVLPNVFFNLNDTMAQGVLVQDKDYILDNMYSSFTAESDENEYYRITNKYFSKDEIADKFADALNSESIVTLRTDFNLGEEESKQIIQSVAEKSQLNQFGWLSMYGVMTISKDVD